jgi:pyruvate, orthophosphate dikinase
LNLSILSATITIHDGGRKTRPNMTIGICGEHGGEPSSVEFCHDIGLDYVSCSPPVARLAAAQAAISTGENIGTR